MQQTLTGGPSGHPHQQLHNPWIQRGQISLNRPLDNIQIDFEVVVTDLGNTERLAPLAPEGALLVGESSSNSHADWGRLAAAGVRCFLVGENLMRQDDVEAATRALLMGYGERCR